MKPEDVRAAVAALLEANKGKPLSVTAMAKQLRVHRERIKEICPDLAAQSTEARVNYRVTRRAEFERTLQGRVDAAIEEMKRAREPMLRYRLLKRFTRNERCALIDFSEYVLGALRSAESALSG